MEQNRSSPRIIKKYPNRRLYDTRISRYITLDDIRKLVLAQEDFAVLDANNNEDLTRSILLQVIARQEQDEEKILSTEALLNLVRCYSTSMQSATTEWIERNITLLLQQQEEFQKQILQQAVTQNPLQIFKDMTENNISIWQELQNDFLRAVTRQNENTPTTEETVTPTAEKNSEQF